jgi:hypothetical protein
VNNDVMFRGVTISARRRLWAGKVWKQLRAPDAQMLIHIAAGYSLDGADRFCVLPWEELGYALQNELILALCRLEDYFARAHR